MSDDEQPDRRPIVRLRTSRMEAFSDGIFAIASTLLVLDLAVPHVGPDVAQKLHDQWPIYLAYLVSFLSIGQAWLNHSVITEYLDRADSILLRLNLVLLFFVSLLPFPTHLVAEYLRTEHAERIAVTVYGLNLLAISAFTSILWHYALAEHLVIGDLVDPGRSPVAECLAGTPGRGFGAAEPPQAEGEHHGRGDDAEPRRGKRRRTEERHRDRVLDRRRSRQGRHGESGSPQRDRSEEHTSELQSH